MSLDWDCQKVLDLIRINKRENFKYLRGGKLSSYWFYILCQFTSKNLFTNLEVISIIPDTHVIQASFKLGITQKIDEKPETVAKLWQEILKRTDLVGIDLHPVLCNWSRNNFQPEIMI